MKLADVHTSEKGGWKPEQGDTITGTIVDIDVTEGAYGPYPVLDFQLEDGTVSVHAFHDLLRRKLSSRGAQVGELVSITYRGRAGNGTEKTDAYLYDVHVGAEPKRFDFDELRYTSEPAKPKEPRRRDVEQVGGSDIPVDPPESFAAKTAMDRAIDERLKQKEAESDDDLPF
jgi:hypothetical protein